METKDTHTKRPVSEPKELIETVRSAKQESTETGLSRRAFTPISPSPTLPPSERGLMRRVHGFSLVELLVVITILVILGTIAFINL